MDINKRVDDYLPERRTGTRAAVLFILFLTVVLLLPASRSAAQEGPVPQGPASIEEDEGIRDDVHESENSLPGVVEESVPPLVGEVELNGGDMGEPDVLPEGLPGGAHIDGVTSFSPLTMLTPPYTDFPYRQTVYMVSSWLYHDDTTCTGSLIASRWVLTTRTCVYQEAWGGGATKIYVFPGYSPDHQPYRSSKGTGHIYYWAGSGAEDNVGFFQIDRPVGGLTGWYQMCPNSDSFLMNTTLSGVGYPYGGGFQPHTMYFWKGTFDYVTAGTLFHNRDGHGMIGSPVYTSGFYDCIYGILGSYSSSGSTYARLTQSKINYVKAYIGEHNENPTTADSFYVLNVVPSKTIVHAGEKLDRVQFDFYNDLGDTLPVDTQIIASVFLIPFWGALNCDTADPIGGNVFYLELRPHNKVTLTVTDLTVPSNLDPGEYFAGVCVKIENHVGQVWNQFIDDQTFIEIFSPVSKPLMLPVIVRP